MLFCSICVQKCMLLIGKFEIKKIKTLYEQHNNKKTIEKE